MIASEVSSATAPGATSASPGAAPGAARRAALWLLPFAALGVALVFLYPDSYQQDGGHHFLFARWSLALPRLLVDVWGRPLFTALYALPAQLGYPAAKLLTVAICLATAWNAFRLAEAHGMARAELAVPLLYVQPSFLLLSSETMTEPLFALVLVAALRLHRAGRVGPAMWVAGLLPLARPEGFFVGVLWGAVTLLDARAGASVVRRALGSLRLAAGTAAWWLESVLITRDPLFLKKNWPSNWGASYSYGTGPLWQYVRVHYEILAGPAMIVLLVLGLAAILRARRAGLAVGTLALVTVLHSVFFHYGMFGSAGYARYLVCVSAPLALVLLAGWNAVADRATWVPRGVRVATAALVLIWSAGHSLVYVDSWGSSRDAWAVRDTFDWFQAHPRPVNKLIASQAYMRIVFDRDPRPDGFAWDPQGRVAENVARLRAAPAGTLVFWDAYTGKAFYKVGPSEFEQAGYELLRRQEYDLVSRLPFALPWVKHHRQVLVLYYKPAA